MLILTAQDAVGQRVAALDALLGRLDRALASEHHSPAMRAHELRTPVTAPRIQAQVAQRAADEAQRRRALEQIVTGVARAGHLVDQLLTLSRLDTQDGALTLGPVVLLEAARRTAETLALPGRERSVSREVTGAEDAFALGDETCVGILLDNAVRNKPAGGEVPATVRNVGPFHASSSRTVDPGLPRASMPRCSSGSGAARRPRRRGAASACRSCAGSASPTMAASSWRTARIGGLRCEVGLPSLTAVPTPVTAAKVAAPQPEVVAGPEEQSTQTAMDTRLDSPSNGVYPDRQP